MKIQVGIQSIGNDVYILYICVSIMRRFKTRIALTILKSFKRDLNLNIQGLYTYN